MVTWVAELTAAATVSFGVVGSSQALHTAAARRRFKFWGKSKVQERTIQYIKYIDGKEKKRGKSDPIVWENKKMLYSSQPKILKAMMVVSPHWPTQNAMHWGQVHIP